ncbi:MAG: aldehyde dehydrogenase family protein, partial [Verrucomicrobiales bacterium]
MKSNKTCQQFGGVNPVTGESLDPQFIDASDSEIAAVLDQAAEAASSLRRFTGIQIGELLDAISLSVESQRDAIVERCQLETGYPAERVLGEFGRMVAAMRRFGRVAQRGDWLAVRIDHGDPERQPLPKPDLRRMNVPIGPVVVFGASNFPLALSVGGSDVASALAAGCPVVVKAHPSHPGTAQLLAESIAGAVRTLKFPNGTFSMVQGVSNFVGQTLVEHPAVRAVAFTGSLGGGRAIFDMAAQREIPVPVYAEMGSLNPQFVFPEMLQDDATGFARRLFAAATMGNGQFCTNPSMVFLAGDVSPFIAQYRALISEYPGAPMLNARIRDAFERGLDRWERVRGLEVLDGFRPAEGVAIGARAACA